MPRPLLVTVLLFAFTLQTAQAQQPAEAPATASLLTAAARSRLATPDTLLDFRTRPVPGGRLDLDAGVMRARYRLDLPPTPRTTPEDAARSAFAPLARTFGWAEDGDDLALQRVRQRPSSSHVVFQQTYHGLPVYQRHVQVNLDRAGQAAMILSGYAPHLRRIQDFDPRPTLSAADARDAARRLVEQGMAEASTPELVVYPTASPRLAWHLLLWPEQADAEWSVLLDARTGALIEMTDQAVRHTTPSLKTNRKAGTAPRRAVRRAPTTEAGARRVTGTGYVFDPDPLTTANITYQPPYVDNNDADIPEVNAQRILVDLPDLTQGNDGLYRLDGPHVRIIGENSAGQIVYAPPAEFTPDGFRYVRSQDGFEAVMVYYHADKSQRHVQQMGFFDVLNRPFPINPQGLLGDDSFYFPGRKIISFGTGGVDDAEDAGVIWHEYAHAMLDDVAPNLLNTNEGGALHEGWADYWAASYVRSLVEADASKRNDWEVMFKWDSGDGQIWPGRTLDHSGHYPEDLSCVTGVGSCNKHDDGRLWATTLMQVYSDLGRTTTDQLVLQSHYYLSAPATMRDAGEALIQADLDLFGGANTNVLLDHLGTRGLVDPGTFGPVITHDALPATEQLGGTVAVNVQARGISDAIAEVFVFYQVDGGGFQQLPLGPQQGDLFTGTLALPETPATVAYYVEAVDAMGRRSVLPGDAPAATYTFTTGPDHTAPEITHTPLASLPLALWPLEITAEVADNLGVDSVWVVYTIERPDGMVVEDGAFGLVLQQGRYRGAVPAPVGTLQKDSVVRYRLHARDTAQAVNETVVPDDDPFTVTVTAEGTLQAYSFEGSTVTLDATGTFSRGTPSYGLEVAHSGRTVWATSHNTAYPAAAGRATLSMPPLNLTGLDEAFLIFWQWYDIEHDGTARVDGQQGGLWDGANVKISTDGGNVWTIATPEGGYTGTIIGSLTNPMSGEPAFGGYSHGWRQVTIPLPVTADLRIRFDFGTDDSNTEVSTYGFAGWYLDDVIVATARPEDATPPNTIALPEALRIQPTTESLPPLTVILTDDTGIADVFVDYEITTATGRVVSTERLDMSTTDLQTFHTTVAAWNDLGAGAVITYFIRTTDFAGNTATYPLLNNSPLRIEYRLVDAEAMLVGVAPSGLWQLAGSRWQTTDGEAPPRSSLVFTPIDLPANVAGAQLLLDHQYNLGRDLGGNVKISTDQGSTWEVLTTTTAYDRAYAPDEPHPMADEQVFTGASPSLQQAAFDLAPYAGQQIRLRIDLAATRALGEGEFWILEQAQVTRSTTDPAFDVPRTLALHANFPNPFAATTTIGYTLPDEAVVTLAVYNLLGRQVAVLVDATQQAGTYTRRFDGSDLASGVYLLRLQAGGTQQVRRLVIAR